MRLNTLSITLSAFLAYFIMSAIITPIGIVSQPLALVLGVEVTTATAIFSWLTTGVFIGSVIAIFVFDFLSIKSVVLSAALLILASVLLLLNSVSIWALSLLLLLAGIGCGVSLSVAAAVITQTYTEKLRPSMLLLTDSFYSGAATISSLFGVYLLSQGNAWWSVYATALAAVLLLLALATPSNYPEAQASESGSVRELLGWPIAVYVCGLSLLMYLVAVVTVYSWLPNYAQQALGMAADESGILVGRYFSGMFFGQLVMFVLVLKLPVRWLVFIALLGATILSALFWRDSELPIARISFLLGFISGGVFKVLVAYGTTLIDEPNPKMVSYLLFNTALGTAIAPALSAWVVAQSGSIASSMIFATASYAVALGLLLLTFLLASNKTTAQA